MKVVIAMSITKKRIKDGIVFVDTARPDEVYGNLVLLHDDGGMDVIGGGSAHRFFPDEVEDIRDLLGVGDGEDVAPPHIDNTYFCQLAKDDRIWAYSVGAGRVGVQIVSSLVSSEVELSPEDAELFALGIIGEVRRLKSLKKGYPSA